jgi:hypothetical protein
MVNLSIALCDLCGKPYEVGSQIHNCEIRATIFSRNCKCYDTIFTMCLDCAKETNIIEIVKNLQKQKDKNEKIRKQLSSKYLTDTIKEIEDMRKLR